MIPSAGNEERGVIYTFYSFKGGVGRSMALANVAALLAKWGYSVLVVDWDVEAPGIERFFALDNPGIQELRANTPGILDLVHAVAEGRVPRWRDCLIPVKVRADSSRLSLLTAGQSGEDYTTRLHALNFPELFDKHDLGWYIEELRKEWASEFDFVLVDSRTGVTDIGGICTVHLADVLVLLFTTTESSAEGALQILGRARKAQERLPVDRQRLLGVPVPSRDESRTEYKEAAQWKDRFAEQFGEVYRDWLPSGVQPREAIEKLRIPYVPYWSFGEKLPVIEEGTTDPTSLGYSYQILARFLASRLDWYKALEGQDSAPPPTPKPRELDSQWLARHRRTALKGLAAAKLTGFMEVCDFCVDSPIQKSQPELLSAVQQAQVRLTGWPFGIVLDNNDESRPRPTNDGILAKVVAEFPSPARRSFDYWTLTKGGDFYALRSLSEDLLDEHRPDRNIWYDVRIIRAAEVLLHCSNLYKLLGVEPNAHIEMRVRYGGLRERELTSAPGYYPFVRRGRNLLENEVIVAPISFRLGAAETEIVNLVKRLCEPLFIVFDFAEIPDESYQRMVTDFAQGKVRGQRLPQT